LLQTNRLWVGPDGNLGMVKTNGTVTIFDSFTLSVSSFRTIAAEAVYNTNLFKVYSGSPTGATQAADTETFYSIRFPTNRPATNLYFGFSNIGGAGTNWLRIATSATVP